MQCSRHGMCGFAAIAMVTCAGASAGGDEAIVLRVRQDALGNSQGTDKSPTLQALARLGKQAGTIDIGPGGGCDSLQPRMAARSSSGVPIGLIANFSTRTSSTLGVTNAGRLGPSRMFLIPRCAYFFKPG